MFRDKIYFTHDCIEKFYQIVIFDNHAFRSKFIDLNSDI